MRSYEDIKEMSRGDYACGIIAHYKPLAAIVNGGDYRTVLEVGTAYANNAEYLLEHTGIRELYCVDPYLFYRAMPGFTGQEEYDTLYRYAHEKLSKHEAFMSIFRMDSKEAFKYFDERGFTFDVIFLDGDHEYPTVKWEIEHYIKLVNPGGVLCGHDYNIFEGVTQAVYEYVSERPLPWQSNFEIHDGNIWSIKL